MRKTIEQLYPFRKEQTLSFKPITFKVAKAFVSSNHRHHKPPVGYKFVVGLVDQNDDLIGVVIAGRPVARRLDNGYTLEITRCCTNGTFNACSMLYSSACRIAKNMGYRKVITYILESEIGTSLEACGFERTIKTPGKTWSVPSRKRNDKHPLGPKVRYERVL